MKDRKRRNDGKFKGKRNPLPRREDGRARGDDAAARTPQSGSWNDISWYSRNPNLLVAAGSFPYPYRPGMLMDLGNPYNTPPSSNPNNQQHRKLQIPGVLVLDWVPSIGISNTAVDPASILAKEMYGRVRAKFSGNLVADGPDFVMYVLALDSVFAYIAWLKRVYRTISAWSPENYVTPDGLLTAYGFADTEIKNLRVGKTKLWQIINELVLQSRKFMIPATMDIFNRHYWMSDNVYTDDSTINSQFYVFNPRALYKFKEFPVDTEGNLASGLEMVALPTVTSGTRGSVASSMASLTVDDLYTYGENLINALVAWDEAYDINGYLIKAYEGEPTFVVAELDPNEKLTPVYVPEVLSQIENSRTVINASAISDFSGFNITQNVSTNAVISNPKYSTLQSVDSATNAVSTLAYTVKPTISIRSETPTVADSVIATRLQAAIKSIESAGSGATATYTYTVIAGTEIPIQWRLIRTGDTAANVGGYMLPGTDVPPYLNVDSEGTINSQILLRVTSLLWTEAFDWHPITYFTMYGSKNGNTYFSANGDIHNMTDVSVDALANLHKICVYSELNAFSL